MVNNYRDNWIPLVFSSQFAQLKAKSRISRCLSTFQGWCCSKILNSILKRTASFCKAASHFMDAYRSPVAFLYIPPVRTLWIVNANSLGLCKLMSLLNRIFPWPEITFCSFSIYLLSSVKEELSISFLSPSIAFHRS